MTILQTILDHNDTFVKEKKYEKYQTTKFPNKKLVVLTCMDTRLTELLPRAMNLKNGDAKIIKNAGAVISHPFGSIMRSIVVALYELQAQEVCIVGHHGCGMAGLKSSSVLAKAEERGVSMEKVETVSFAGININEWLNGFSNVEESVMHSVQMVKKHPLLPPNTPVHGLVICPETGKLDLIVDGYEDITND
ncbi:carbonic anhydrase [Alkalihalobacillus sp. BA299]|uniref:beta-class carbonic anhydrase n=1 Tax=Alkalihalobacillus sp. BA299 TaxID=2815938 RepID=UPI001ADAAE1D|nr:carbonic anhydrase [Alkalihalobacillus sp. BA299]